MKTIIIMLLLAVQLCPAQPNVQIINGAVSEANAKLPAIESKKFVDLSKAWITELQRSDNVFEISNVTNESLTISGILHNAFYYRERGETHWQDIKVVFKIAYSSNSISIKTSIPEVYSSEGTLLKYTLPDYFYNGTLKDGYNGLTDSLQSSLNQIISSYYNFIINYH